MQKKPPAMTLMPNQTRLINAAEGFQLEVISGCLWVTRPDDAEDHFLVAGRSLPLRERYVLIQSDKLPKTLCLAPAHYRLVPLKAPSASLTARVAICWQFWSRQIIRRLNPTTATLPLKTQPSAGRVG
jgi:hypothetical protein